MPAPPTPDANEEIGRVLRTTGELAFWALVGLVVLAMVNTAFR